MIGVDSHVIRHLKPQPTAFDAILTQLGSVPDRAVLIGDGGSDELSGARDFVSDTVGTQVQAALRAGEITTWP